MENRSSIPSRRIVELSRRLPAVSHRKEQEFVRKTPKKSESFADLTVSSPYCPTWVINTKNSDN
jgi:hypothetical protein